MKHENDPLEHSKEEIMSFYKKALDVLKLSNNNSSAISVLKTIELNNEYIFYGSFTQKEIGVAYISCFSINESSDALKQKIIKKSGSYSILEFFFSNIYEERIKAFDRGYNHYFQKVVYDDNRKISLMEQFLSNLLEYSMKEETLKHCVQTFLNLCRFSFKPVNYHEEEEIRSLIIIPKFESDRIENECRLKKERAHYSALFDAWDFSQVIC